MIRAVFFDVGGTLIHPWPSVGAVYARLGEQHGLAASAESMEHAFRSAWEESKHGLWTTSDREWWRALVGRTVANLGLAVPDGYFEALYDAFAQADAWRIFPDTLPTLDALRTHGLHVGIISNWDQRLRPLLDRLGLEARVDSLTISCEVGVEKPARKIYQAALAAANVPPQQDSIHVGDSVQEDLEGATAAGMRALLVRQTGANDLDRVLSLL